MKNEAKIFRLNCDQKKERTHEDHHTRLAGYDEWAGREENERAELLDKLNDSGSLSGYDSSRKYDFLNEHNLEQRIPDQEDTLLTGDEILHECELTMQDIIRDCQKRKKADSELHSNKNTTQSSIVFRCTISVCNNVKGFMNEAGREESSNETEDQEADIRIVWETVLTAAGKKVAYVDAGEEHASTDGKNYDRSDTDRTAICAHAAKRNSNGK